MQTIDPIKRPYTPPPQPRGSNSSYSVDGIRPSARAVPPSEGTPPLTGARFTKLKPTVKKRRARDLLITVVVSPILLFLSALSIIGMAVVVLYGVFAIVLRLDSRITFVLALTAFVFMFLLQITTMSAWAQTEAVFAYLLLTIGVISLALETRRSHVMWSKKQ